MGENLFDMDISAWDTAKATTMEGMFFKNIRFSQDISGWDVSRVQL